MTRARSAETPAKTVAEITAETSAEARRAAGRWLLLALAAAIWAALCLAAPAAGPTPLPGSGTALKEAQSLSESEMEAILDSPEAVRALVAELPDEEVRRLLIERLDAVAKIAEAAEDTGLAAFSDNAMRAVDGFARSVTWAYEVSPNLAAGVGTALSRFAEPRGTTGILHVLAVLAVAIGAGLLVRRLVARGLALAWPQRPPLAPHAPLASLAAEHGGRALRIALESAAMLLATWAVIRLGADAGPDGPRPNDYLVLYFFWKEPICFAVASAAVARFALAPGAPERRLLHLDDETAAILARGLVIFGSIVGIRAYALSFVGGHGIALAELRLGFWMSVAMYAWMLWLAWRTRAGLTRSLIGDIGEITRTERRLAQAYPYAAMALIALFWLLSEVFTGLGLWNLLDGRLPLTLVILIFAPAADRVIRALVYRVAPPEEGAGAAAARAFAATRRGYIRIGRIMLAFLLLLLLQRIWGFSLTDMAGAGVGARFTGRLIEASIIIGTGYLAIEAVAIWINGLLAREKGPAVDEDEPGGGEGGGTGGSRLATVLPLLSFSAQGAILVITLLTGLGALGVDTTPLLAGAGIVGIAVGFGAQTLVSDVVSGIFFLIDDAFRTGEYVEVEGTVGTVEKISVRSMRLRHHEGRLHTIPYGQIPKLTNYSRDWVIMKLRFTVPFDTDLQKVKKIFKKIGAEMMEDERFKADFLQPFKSQGVLEVDDVGIVIRGKFMAKPGKQWTLRKEIYQRVQQAFEENGLQFARKEVRVKLDGDPGALTPEQQTLVGAAAADAAERPPAPEGRSEEPR
ncbi:hypothetical protein LNKW23_09380 [Paralimibaculum aggregatum]|uniref:Small-conductance mechanosensitive channel n=1 Tax=Paralimibaculum aggregatum TaxID=3036245 RepID=A0ABQ6LHM4_9RHOB|nr:mechanosensitive ion channel family protein [Limibaculum sp. NKW23]GMG81725.1 hypothetical protein LNKW23_09380 [Limibaculum sp. NKW23]